MDAGEPFVKSTYILEGNGPPVFKCYDQIQILQAGIDNIILTILMSMV